MRKYSLLGTHFVLDEEKILREGIYDLEDVYKTIEEIALECRMIKIDKNTYHAPDDEHCLADLGIFTIRHLVKCSWFTLNLKKWTWVSQKDGNKDLILDFKSNNKGVWR